MMAPPASVRTFRIGTIRRVTSVPKIWYRKSKKACYLQVDRHTQKRLGKTLAQAEAAYRAWLLDQGEPLPAREVRKLTVGELAQQFLDHC